MKMARETLESIIVERPESTEEQPQGICLDKGYDYEEVRTIVDVFGFTSHIRSRGEEAQELAAEAGRRARRWVVERSHSWMNRFRRVLIRWDKKAENYLGFLHFSCALIAFRAASSLSESKTGSVFGSANLPFFEVFGIPNGRIWEKRSA